MVESRLGSKRRKFTKKPNAKRTKEGVKVKTRPYPASPVMCERKRPWGYF